MNEEERRELQALHANQHKVLERLDEMDKQESTEINNIEHIGRMLDDHGGRLSSIENSLATLNEALAMARGGLRVLIGVAGVAAALGAFANAIMRFFQNLGSPHGP